MQGYNSPPPGGYGPPPGGYAPPGYPTQPQPPYGYGPPNPYAGQAQPMMAADPGECALARQALTYAIIGLFCFGVVLGPLAISKARSAKMIIAGTPGMRGDGMATAALIIGICDLALWAVGLVARIALMH